MALTKSLHTVTSATAVARLLVTARLDSVGASMPAYRPGDEAMLASSALLVLGHAFRPEDLSRDVTGARIVANCAKLIASAQ